MLIKNSTQINIFYRNYSLKKKLESNSNNENDRSTNNNCSRIHQFYGEELLAISKHDPLHELTVQEKDLVRRNIIDFQKTRQKSKSLL